MAPLRVCCPSVARPHSLGLRLLPCRRELLRMLLRLYRRRNIVVMLPAPVILDAVLLRVPVLLVLEPLLLVGAGLGAGCIT